MSVTLDWPAAGTVLTAADGRVGPEGLTLTLRGTGPRRSPVFVNDVVLETDDAGRFTCEVTLAPGEGWLVAGLLTGCARVTQKVPISVRL